MFYKHLPAVQSHLVEELLKDPYKLDFLYQNSPETQYFCRLSLRQPITTGNSICSFHRIFLRNEFHHILRVGFVAKSSVKISHQHLHIFLPLLTCQVQEAGLDGLAYILCHSLVSRYTVNTLFTLSFSAYSWRSEMFRSGFLR